MDVSLFTRMLSDKSIIDLKKLATIFPQANQKEFVEFPGSSFYKFLPLKDCNGGNLVYLDSVVQVQLSVAKILLTPQEQLSCLRMAGSLWGTKFSPPSLLIRSKSPRIVSAGFYLAMPLPT